VYVVEVAGLQIGFRRADFRHRGLGQNVGGDVFDRRARDFVDEADVLVLAGCDMLAVCPRAVNLDQLKYFG